jgi:hypothetical protein
VGQIGSLLNIGTTEQVWASMPGAAQLYEIYGYWPTLHDASVRAMNVRWAGQELEMIVDYNDLVNRQGQEVSVGTRITLVWIGVSEVKLRLYDEDLYGIAFTTTDMGVETRFDDYTWGLDGYIRSTGIQVTRVEPAPDLSGLSTEDPAHHEIRFSLS